MMRKKLWILLAMVLIIPAFLFTVSCQKQTVKTEEPMAEPAAEEPAPVGEEPTPPAEVTSDASLDADRSQYVFKRAHLLCIRQV